MRSRSSKRTAWTVALVGLSLLLAAGAAQAAPKGPRASILVSTLCSVDIGEAGSGIADLVVTTTVLDTSSGGAVAVLEDGSQIQGTYKKKSVRGNKFFDVAGWLEPLAPGEIDGALMETVRFDICGQKAVVDDARELNASVTVVYGAAGSTDDPRTVDSRCGDDPATDPVEGGIYLEDVLLSIGAACRW